MSQSKIESAIYCKNLSKEFYVIDENLNWRIVFRDVEKSRLNSFKVIDGINLEVPKGKFIGILGRNGAGKSTLLRILGGIYSPSDGIVKITGNISSLFELGGHGNTFLSGHSYANRYLDLMQVPQEGRAKIIQNIKQFSELNEAFEQPIYTYSTGMAARLYFATATELQSDIYLVDELLSVGDEHFQAKCWKRLRSRFLNGASGILVTHDWQAVMKLCEKTAILDKGKIIAIGDTDKIVQKYLDLPVPTKEYAEILIENDIIQLESESDCSIDFKILLKRPLNLEMNYSIEMYRASYGWENILLNESYIPLNCKSGMNRTSIKFKSLPLNPGDYFLKSTDTSIDNSKIESRSWTYGNGIRLRVTGSLKKSIISLPWKKSFQVMPYVN